MTQIDHGELQIYTKAEIKDGIGRVFLDQSYLFSSPWKISVIRAILPDIGIIINAKNEKKFSITLKVDYMDFSTTIIPDYGTYKSVTDLYEHLQTKFKLAIQSFFPNSENLFNDLPLRFVKNIEALKNLDPNSEALSTSGQLSQLIGLELCMDRKTNKFYYCMRILSSSKFAKEILVNGINTNFPKPIISLGSSLEKLFKLKSIKDWHIGFDNAVKKEHAYEFKAGMQVEESDFPSTIEIYSRTVATSVVDRERKPLLAQLPLHLGRTSKACSTTLFDLSEYPSTQVLAQTIVSHFDIYVTHSNEKNIQLLPEKYTLELYFVLKTNESKI